MVSRKGFYEKRLTTIYRGKARTQKYFTDVPFNPFLNYVIFKPVLFLYRNISLKMVNKKKYENHL